MSTRAIPLPKAHRSCSSPVIALRVTVVDGIRWQPMDAVTAAHVPSSGEKLQSLGKNDLQLLEQVAEVFRSRPLHIHNEAEVTYVSDVSFNYLCLLVRFNFVFQKF